MRGNTQYVLAAFNGLLGMNLACQPIPASFAYDVQHIKHDYKSPVSVFYWNGKAMLLSILFDNLAYLTRLKWCANTMPDSLSLYLNTLYLHRRILQLRVFLLMICLGSSR